MPPERDLRLTREFSDALFDIRKELGTGTAAFDRALAEAVEELLAKGFHIASPHGKTGEDFAYPVGRAHVLIFHWVTDRDGEGRVLAEHAELLTIERVKR